MIFGQIFSLFRKVTVLSFKFEVLLIKVVHSLGEVFLKSLHGLGRRLRIDLDLCLQLCQFLTLVIYLRLLSGDLATQLLK